MFHVRLWFSRSITGCGFRYIPILTSALPYTIIAQVFGLSMSLIPIAFIGEEERFFAMRVIYVEAEHLLLALVYRDTFVSAWLRNITCIATMIVTHTPSQTPR